MKFLGKSILLLSTCVSDVVLSATAFSAVVKDTAAPTAYDTIWDEVPEGPPDAILGIAQAFRAARVRGVRPAVDTPSEARVVPRSTPSATSRVRPRSTGFS